MQFEEIKKIIARYHGQVTLGKILTVVFHEGRKPLNALKQHPNFINVWSKEFIKLVEKTAFSKTDEFKQLYDKILDRLQDNKSQAEIFINMFKKLEPLANTKRASSKEFKVIKPINDAFKLFDNEMQENNITYSIKDEIETIHKGWEIDIQIAFANLIENSIYWMKNSTNKNIIVSIINNGDIIIIDYKDTGVGIDEENIQNQDIFDPGFSTKEDGTGIGLSIAGEAIERNNGKIEAISSVNGANFIIKLTKL